MNNKFHFLLFQSAAENVSVNALIKDETVLSSINRYDSTAKRSVKNNVVGAEYLPPAYMAVYSTCKKMTFC